MLDPTLPSLCFWPTSNLPGASKALLISPTSCLLKPCPLAASILKPLSSGLCAGCAEKAFSSLYLTNIYHSGTRPHRAVKHLPPPYSNPSQPCPRDLTLMTRSTKPLSSSLETGV
jgi:hypothetical protein